MTRTSLALGKRGKYIQNGMAVNTLKSFKRNMNMPLRDPGSLSALGGEFVLSPTWHGDNAFTVECVYAHRMKNTRDHAELLDILKAIGLSIPNSFLPNPEQRNIQKKSEMKRYKNLEKIRTAQVGTGVYKIRSMDNPELDINTEVADQMNRIFV